MITISNQKLLFLIVVLVVIHGTSLKRSTLVMREASLKSKVKNNPWKKVSSKISHGKRNQRFDASEGKT